MATRVGLALLVVFTLAGCVTVGEVPRYKNEGLARTYPVTHDQAWVIARGIFRRLKAVDAIEERREENLILTSTGLDGWTYGAVMGAWIERVDAQNTRVTVVTKRRFQANAFTSLTETTFHERFADAVEAMRGGQPTSK
jgi:hypothetical protein